MAVILGGINQSFIMSSLTRPRTEKDIGVDHLLGTLHLQMRSLI